MHSICNVQFAHSLTKDKTNAYHNALAFLGPFNPPPQPTLVSIAPVASPIPISNALGRTPPYLTGIQLQAARNPSSAGTPINGFATFEGRTVTTCLGTGKLPNVSS